MFGFQPEIRPATPCSAGRPSPPSPTAATTRPSAPAAVPGRTLKPVGTGEGADCPFWNVTLSDAGWDTSPSFISAYANSVAVRSAKRVVSRVKVYALPV